MKRYLIYILLIISSICYGQIYSTTNSNIQYNSFQSTSYYNQPARGYNNSYNNVNYNTSKFGYRTNEKIRYVEINQNKAYMSSYNNSLNTNIYDDYISTNETSGISGPRRAPGDHASGSETATVDGYSATISWNINAYILGWRLWTITYSDGTSETIWCSMEEAKQYAKKVAEDKARQQAEKMAENAKDPYADPIGEFPIGLLLILMFSYLLYKKKINNKRTVKL